MNTQVKTDALPCSVLQLISNLNGENYFYITASGYILTEAIPSEIVDDYDAIITHINDHKADRIECEDAEIINNMIDELANTLEFVSKSMIKKYIATIPAGLLKTLRDSAVADIWYDASCHQDYSAAEIITETQNAMSNLADFFTEYQ